MTPRGKPTQAETQEAAVYRIFVNKHASGEQSKTHYTIEKRIMDTPVELYAVTIKSEGRADLQLWCDCPGFRVQKYPKIDHKHIKIAMDYQSRGQPEWAEYRILGKNKIRFIREKS